MKPEQLLTHFHRISEAPDAIPRLRRFILDLAVRGKLVEQDPKDEPASELLKRIQIEKERLVKAGEGRKGKPFSPLEEDDVPFRVPNNWSWSQLAEIGFINPRNIAVDDLLASFVPMSLISTDCRVANKHEVRPWAEMKSGYTHFAEGDVALAKITPCFENGKSTVFRGLTGGIGAGTTELHVVRPIAISADYVLIFLKCPHFIESGIPKMTGTAGQKRVPTEYFAYSPFPLPPLAEQHRIVAKVDELMSLCDQLEAAQTERENQRNRLVASSLHRLNNGADPDAFREHARFYFTHLPRLTTRPDHIKQLRQTILNLAVRGKLVPQDPTDEPASELLKRIQTVKARQLKSGELKKQQALADTGKIEAPFEIPDSWCWGHMDDCFAVNGGIQKTPARTPKNNPYPYIGVANVYRGRLDLSKVKQFELFEGDLKRFMLMKGDILVVEGNGSPNEIGRCAMWSGEMEKCVHQNHIIRCRPFILGFTPYALRFLNSPNGIEIMKAMAITSSGLYSLSVGKIRTIGLPIPPLAEQHRIVAKMDELLALCDRLETQLTTTQSETGQLLDSILHEVFAE